MDQDSIISILIVTFLISIAICPVSAGEEFTGWEGEVTLAWDEANIKVAEHEAGGDTALSALDRASESGGFSYDVNYGTWGHYLNSIGGIQGSWIFLLNGEQAPLGIGNYQCADGDILTLYNGTWGGAPDYAPSPVSESDAVVNITVQRTERFTGWEGGVTLAWDEANITVTGHEAGGDTALSALDKVSETGAFIYDISYGTWGHYLNSIGRIEGSWIFLVNSEQAPLGIGNYRCADGDLLTFYNGTWGGAPDYAPSPVSESDAVVNITVHTITTVGDDNMLHGDAARTGYVPEAGPQTDNILWETELGGAIGASPVVSEDRVYIPNLFSMNPAPRTEYGLYCIDAETGNILWRNDLNMTGGSYSTPAVSDNRVFVGTYEGDLFCIDEDGRTLWNRTVENEGLWWGLASSPLVYDDKVFVSTGSDATLHAFDMDGTELWTFATGGSTSYYASPAAENGRIYFAGTDGLYCIDPEHPEKDIWNFTTDSEIKSSTVALSGDVAFFSTAKSLCAVSTAGESVGSELWSIPFSGTLSTPAVKGNTIYAAGSDCILYSLDTADSSENWHYDLQKHEGFDTIYSSPVVTDDTLYIGRNYAESEVYAIDADTGALVWKYSLNPPEGEAWNIMSSPAISGGTLFIGADDGKIRAFGPGGAPPEPSYATLSDLTVTSGARGGIALAHLSATGITDGWFVIVTSGTGAGGDNIAGITTIHLGAGETVNVPVLVQIPAQAGDGTYNLHAGIYRLADYPDNLDDSTGGIECNVL